jgi:hypothetical protein
MIPDAWRTKVVAILEGRGASGLILTTRRATSNWSNLDEDHYIGTLYTVLSEVLRSPGLILKPSKVNGMKEPGECYDFSFMYRPPRASGELQVYAKVNLLEGELAIFIYSAHP